MITMLKQWLTWVTRPVVEIRPGERVKTLLMFFYFFFVISLIYILKPVRSSLFLGELGAEKLPYVYMGEGVWLIFVVWAYVQFSKRVSKQMLYRGVLGFFIMNLIVFRVLFHYQVPYLAAFFYVWVASVSITMTTLFWTLANDIFNPLEAKRLFGFIISGGSLGGILGGLMTRQAVQFMKTEDLLMVAAGVLFICILLIGAMWREIPNADKPLDENKTGPDASDSGEEKTALHRLMMGSSYVLALGGMIMIAKIASTVVDNQFNRVVELSITGKEARTAFFGGFWSWLNALSFVMQLVVTRLCLRYLGIGFSLWILPVGLMLLSGASILYPILATGLLFKCFDGSVTYSVQQASKEVLYLPLSSSIRYRVKPIIDMLGYRAAKSLGGLYIVAMVPLLGLTYDKLAWLVVILLPIWFFLIWNMRRGYSAMLQQYLHDQKKFDEVTETKRATDVLSFLNDEKDFEEIKSFMAHESTYARKLAATAHLTYDDSQKDLESARRVVEELARQEAFHEEHDALQSHGITADDIEFLNELMMAQGLEKLAGPEGFPDYVEQHFSDTLVALSAVLTENDRELALKRRAVKILGNMPRQETVDLLLHKLAGAQDHAFRFIMIKILRRMKIANEHLQVNRVVIKSEIAREAAVHRKVQKLRLFYRTQWKQKDLGQNYLEVAFEAMLDESLERIFDYLKILYSPEAILVVQDRIRNYPADDELRAHAFELLANTIEPDISFAMMRILDAKAQEKLQEKDVVKILKGFSKSQDRWLFLIGYFLISRTDLESRWPELGKYEDASPVRDVLTREPV